MKYGATSKSYISCPRCGYRTSTTGSGRNYDRILAEWGAPKRICSKCLEIKLSSEYYSGRPDCKVCTRKEHQAYREANREKVRLTNNRWQREHAEERKRKRRADYLANREKILKRAKGYYRKHKEKRAAYAKEYYRKHREEILLRTKLWTAHRGPEVERYQREYYLRNRERILERQRNRKGSGVAA